jgi:hypothetical protein
MLLQRAPWQFGASITSDTAHAEGLAAPMTVLRDFIDEIGNALDARKDKPLAPHHWLGFVKLIDVIDRDDGMGKLRQQVEQIVSQRDVRFQDRCLALIPLLSADPGIAATFNRRRQAAITALAAL